jgi:hypothetical protein
MPKLTVVFDDKLIIKDGVSVEFTGEGIAAFDAVVSAQGHSDKNAIQWDGTSGDIETKDGSANVACTANIVTAYANAFDAEKERQKQEELAQDAVAMAKEQRNALLAETDHEALADRTMSEAMVAYRQALRDLPADTANWNPVLVWDFDTNRAVVAGVNFPTKPE